MATTSAPIRRLQVYAETVAGPATVTVGARPSISNVQVFDVRSQPFLLLKYIYSVNAIDVVPPPSPISMTTQACEDTVIGNKVQGKNRRKLAKLFGIGTSPLGAWRRTGELARTEQRMRISDR